MSGYSTKPRGKQQYISRNKYFGRRKGIPKPPEKQLYAQEPHVTNQGYQVYGIPFRQRRIKHEE